MTDQQKEFVRSKVLQFINGNTPEKNKLEFKRKWYDLKDKQGREYFEFLKDACGIINSRGGDDGYIIIGVGEDGNLYNSNIADSGRNQNEIKDIIGSEVDDQFLIDIDYINFNEKQLSIILIHPTTNKPHVIKKYKSPSGNLSENQIFIRNGSGSKVASKYDIDGMYWERGNIVLSEQLRVSIDLRSIEYSSNSNGEDFFGIISFACYFENLGLRPISIYDFEISASVPKVEGHVLATKMTYRQTILGLKFESKSNYLVIPVNTPIDYTFHLISKKFSIHDSFYLDDFLEVDQFKERIKKIGKDSIEISDGHCLNKCVNGV